MSPSEAYWLGVVVGAVVTTIICIYVVGDKEQ